MPTALVALSLTFAVADIPWPFEDFIQYWSAGRLNAAGMNPYDPAAMLQEQRAIGWTDSVPVMMYNPPWTLALAMPVSAVDFRLARSIWLPLQIFLTLWCASRLWILYGGSPDRSTRAWFLALLWSPTLLALRFGQLSPVILLGLVGFLWCVVERRDFAAGAFLALTSVKPQLTMLVWIAFGLWVLVGRRWMVIAGSVACVAGTSLVALAFNPRVFSQYFELMASAPPTLTFESPNVASLLRAVLHTRGSWPQYVPTLAGAAAVVELWRRHHDDWDWRRYLPGLVLLSCLVTSYGGWAFDLVVLLVPIVALSATLTRGPVKSLAVAGGAAFLLVSGLAFAMHTAQAAQASFIWMTPAVAIAWWTLKRATHSVDPPIAASPAA